MKNKLAAFIALLLLFFAAADLTPGQSSVLPKKIAASMKKGKSYAAARRVLSANGWKPVNNYKNLPDFNRDHYVVKTLHFYEMEDCSGTGLGLCNFLFKNKNGKVLTVTTGNNEEGMQPIIVGFRVN